MDFNALLGGVIGVGGLIISGLLLIGLGIGVWFFIQNWKKYQQFKVLIIRIDALGNRHAFWDDAGIFIKNGQKRFWMRKTKCDITPDTIKHIDIETKKTVVLWQMADNDFRVVDFSASNPVEGITATIGEEDVNWGLLAYERGKKMFWWQGILKEYMPYIAIFFIGIVFVIIFIQFFKKLDLIPQAIAAMKEVVNTLKETALILQEIKSGTTVIGG